MIQVYTDGSCLGNPGPGGWAAIIIAEDGTEHPIYGSKDQATNNQMEVQAAIEALEEVPIGSVLEIFSDSMYLVNTMSKNWRRNKNHVLWKLMDATIRVKELTITWTWVKAHNGNEHNEEVDRLARSYAREQQKLNAIKPLA